MCYNFSKSYACSSGFFSGFSGSPCVSMLVHLCTCRQKPVNESWPVNIGAHCQRRQTGLHPLKILYIQSIKIQRPISNNGSIWGSVAEGWSALNQHWVFYMNNRTFEMLHFNIEIVIASNTKRRHNVVLLFCQRHRL